MTRSSSTRARAKGLSCKDQCPRVCAFGDVKRFGLTCSSESFPSLICAALGWGGSHLRRQRERTVVGSGCAHIHGHEREGGVHQGRRHFRSFWTRRFREPRFREKITTSAGYPRIRGRKKNAQHGVSVGSHVESDIASTCQATAFPGRPKSPPSRKRRQSSASESSKSGKSSASNAQSLRRA